MSSTSSHNISTIGPDDEPRLRDEHAFLERQLESAIALAEADDWQAFETTWESFMAALEQHTQFEQTLILPAFARSGPTAKLEMGRLEGDLEELRSEARFLDGESQLPDLFIEQLRYLLQVLRAHKELAECDLHPWLSTMRPEPTPEGLKRLEACCASRHKEDTGWDNPLRHEQAAQSLR